MSRKLLIALLAALLVPGAANAQKLAFSIVTGGTGGVWYPLGGAIASVIGKNVPNTDASSEATTAALDNLKLLAAGKAGMAFAYDYHAIQASEGTGLVGKALGKKQPVRVVMSFYEQPLHVVTKDGSGIKSLRDLKGRRVSVGAPNSGTEEQADYVLKALGIDWNKDFKKEKLGASESVAALRDGKIDAFFWSGGLPTGAIIDLATTPGMKMVLVPVGGEVRATITKANPGVFHATKFPKGCYSSVDADVDAIAITAVLTAMESFPADKLEKILEAVFANLTEISAVSKETKTLTPQKSVEQISPEARAFLHPGARKFFASKGAVK
jgi:TRAP transporter TAXI family solute receptor